MKANAAKILCLILASFFLPGLEIPAQEKIDSLFQEIYVLIRQGDQFRYQGKNQDSLEKYRAALTKLDEISLKNPDWNREGVKSNADYCASFLWERLPDICGKGKGIAGKKLSISFIDVGQGDSTLIQCPEGQNILIDGGAENAGSNVVNYLKANGIYIIDLLIATHPDADHIGGLREVIKTIKVNKLVDSGKPHTTICYQNLLSLVKEKGNPYVLGRAGDSYRFGDLTLDLLNPPETLFEDTNNCSVVAQLNYGEMKFLFTGDAAEEAERTMCCNKRLCRCQILKAGHHGSHHSTGRDLLLAAKPEVAIISCGKDNSFGHPHKDLLARLEQADCDFFRTDECGDIRVESDGKKYQVITTKQTKPKAAALPKTILELDKINVNWASAEELNKLPMIGPVRAKAIVEYRNQNGSFKCIDDIVKVKGIGPKTLEKIRDRITVGHGQATPFLAGTPPPPQRPSGAGEASQNKR